MSQSGLGAPSRWRTDRGFVDLLQVVRRHLWVVVLATAAAIGGSFALSSAQQPIYAADAQLLVLPRSTGAVFDQSAVTNALSLERAIDTEIRVIEGQVVRARVQQDLGLAAIPPAVRAQAVDATDVVSLAVRSGDPRVARLVADAYAQAYIETRREQAVASLDSARAELQVKVDELQGQIAELDQQVASAAPEAQAGVQASVGPQRSALVDQQASFKARLDQFEVDAALTTGGASVVQSASEPMSPVEPKPMTTAVLAAMLGMLLGLGAAFALDNVDDSVRGSGDLAHLTSRPVLASVPVASAPDARPIALTAPHEVMIEAYRELRTNLQFLGLDEPLHLLLVTSSAPGEGKTTTATNLAVVISQAGQRVLLIDADLRRPNVHHAFDLAPVPGLTEVLLGEPIDLVVNVTDGLDVITAGTIPPNPSELLASERFVGVLRDVAARYDVVVIDSAPLLPVADSIALASTVDGVVLVTQAGRTSRRAVEATVARLEMVKANLVGFVLNRARSDRRGYGYGYGYGYGDTGLERADDDGLEWTEDLIPARRWWPRRRHDGDAAAMADRPLDRPAGPRVEPLDHPAGDDRMSELL